MSAQDFKLDEADLASPLMALQQHWDEAKKYEEENASRCVLSTVNQIGQPTSRMILFKKVDINQGIQFFSHYNSHKANDLQKNENASISIYWACFDLQWILNGKVTKASSEESDQYFAQRSRSSQLGAWASQQSQKLESREKMQKALETLEKKYDGLEIPRPAHWGGYWLRPQDIDVLQRKEHRWHDRFSCQRDDDSWSCQRLWP